MPRGADAPGARFVEFIDKVEAFFKSSEACINRLRNEGAEFISDTRGFRKVFGNRTGITVSTIHGVKGAEYDAVIAYGLLQALVPHFSNPDGDDSANRLLYVICSQARKKPASNC